ncbi:MAG: 2-oxo acid dehydrogenase subunit E2 [Parvularculaceae bacterium]|nr:2-oxo acid dehydrogenase subunit E2 [Parvularculaceae bacterium]
MTDMRPLEVPKWGLSMEEGTVTKWLIAEGDAFAEGDEIAEIETDKIANVVEAPFTGRLAKIVAEPGTTLPVGALIAVSAPDTADLTEISAYISSRSDGADPAPAADEPAPAAAPAADAAPANTPAAPVATGGDISSLQSSEDDSSVAATPHAHRLAVDYGVSLLKIEATGRYHRVTRDDVRRAILSVGGTVGEEVEAHAATAVPAAAASAAAPASKPPTPISDGYVSLEPLGSMRRTIAGRLQASKQSAPHYRVVMDVEIDALLALRKQLNTRHEGVKISVNDFLIKACAAALMKVPACNVQFDGEQVATFDQADITVAVAMPDGLITPKIKAANAKGLARISSEMKDLATRAREGGLTPDEYQGGTFTISNLGMFGVDQFDAIINPPQCAILAVGRGKAQYVPGPDGPREVNTLKLSLSSDHRVIDGAVAAQFLATVREMIEQPEMMIA